MTKILELYSEESKREVEKSDMWQEAYHNSILDSKALIEAIKDSFQIAS